MAAKDGDNSPANDLPQVPVKKRFLWGLGGGTDFLIYNGLTAMCDQIYVIGLGLRPEMVGLARSLPRLLDILTDPLIGYFSDNTHSRWGRRRPWMFVGMLVAAIIAVIMWYPPMGASSASNIHSAANIYVVAMLVLLFTFGYSFFTIPYTAQGYELSTDYLERTHIFKWRFCAFAAAGCLTPWFPAICLKLEGAQAEVTKGTVGVHWLSIGIAAMLLLTAAGPIFGCREKGEYKRRPKVRFIEAFALTLRNTAFWPLVLGNFLTKFGMSITGYFFYYVMVYYLSGNDGTKGAMQWGVFLTVLNGVNLLSMTPAVKFSTKVGKKGALLTLMLCSAVAYATVWFTLRPHPTGWVADVAGAMQRFYIPALIAEMWPSLVTAMLIGMFCNTMPMIVNSMLADVCDVDELNGGHRREAFYGAVFVTCDKIAMATALFLQGFLLSASGFDSKFKIQTVETIGNWMKALLFTQPVGFLLGFCCILFYPITRATAFEVRRQLDQRHQAAADTPE
jgi:GPH family glycoside/pentoside/hexuronide:cation symporter